MENLLVPGVASATIPATRVLVIAPHPDDEVFGCGGALLRHVADGVPVRVVIWTAGAWGVEPEARAAYIEQRKSESIAAAKVLGYGMPEFRGHEDRGLRYGEDLVCELLALIDATQADLVYAPSVLEMHPDHRVLALAAVEAVRRRGEGVRIAMYEVGIPLHPNTLLDISDLAERKLEAMQCFGSQLAKQRYDLDVAALNRFRSFTLPTAVTAAEAYTIATGAELLRDPLGLHQSEYTRQRALGLQLDSGDFPLVSVIIRSMDRACLAAALDSVALQTYANIEVVVVNAKGVAHRDPGAWCGRFPLRLIEPGRPLERSAACNAGLDAARGELLIFLDDDDYFLPHHVARLQQELAHNEQAIAAYAAVQCVDRDGKEIRRYAEPFDSVRLAIGNYIPIHALLFRRTALARGARFDESLPVCEDWDFWLQLMDLGPFRFVAETGAVYRMHIEGGSGVWQDEERNRRVIMQIHRRRMPQWSDSLLWGVFERTHYKPLFDELTAMHAQVQQELTERNAQLQYELSNRNAQLADSMARVQASDLLIADLRKTVAEKDAALAHRARAEDALVASVRERDKRIETLYASTSWRITRPLRGIARLVREGPTGLLSSLRQAPPSNPYVQDYEAPSDPGPAPFVCELVGEGRRVLELGCGPGSMTKLLKEKLGSHVTAIEVDSAAVEAARQWCDAIHRTDLNSPEWPQVLGSDARFDSVVATDVLEHLYDPWSVLRQMAALLAPKGDVVVSLPHAGHAAIAACLVNSDVRYSQTGLLDRTHIRFFGLKNIEDLFSQAGLKIIAVRHVVRSPEDTELADSWRQVPEALRTALRSTPYGYIYQVVVKAVPRARSEAAVSLL